MALPVLWFIRKEITKQVSYELLALRAIKIFPKDFNWSSVWVPHYENEQIPVHEFSGHSFQPPRGGEETAHFLLFFAFVWKSSRNCFWYVPPNTGCPVLGGIVMKYSYTYKRTCVEWYRERKRPETPEGLKKRNFRCRVRKWVRMEAACGPKFFNISSPLRGNRKWCT